MSERVKIVSNGESHSTHIFLDGKQLLNVRSMSIAFPVQGLATVTLEMYVDEIEIDGHCEVQKIEVAP